MGCFIPTLFFQEKKFNPTFIYFVFLYKKWLYLAQKINHNK